MEKDGAEAQNILNDIRRIVRVLRESSRAAESQVGLSGAQLFVLQRLGQTDTLSVSALAEQTLTHQSTVSVVVKRLAGLGLVNRIRSQADGRCVEVSLTPKGKALLKKAPEAAQERLIEGVIKLKPEDRNRLAASLRQLVESMGIQDRPVEMFFEDSAVSERTRA